MLTMKSKVSLYSRVLCICAETEVQFISTDVNNVKMQKQANYICSHLYSLYSLIFLIHRVKINLI